MSHSLFHSARRFAAMSFLAACALYFPTKNAHAQTFYTDPNAFRAVVTNPTVYDFEDAAPTGFVANPSLQSISFLVSGGTDTQVYAASPIFGRGTYSLNGTSSVLAGLSGKGNFATTRVDLKHLCTAFAAEVGQSGNRTNLYTIRLYRGNQQVGTYCNPGVRQHFFIGVTSRIPFDNVRFTTRSQTGGYTVFDNVEVSNIAPSKERIASRQ